MRGLGARVHAHAVRGPHRAHRIDVGVADAAILALPRTAAVVAGMDAVAVRSREQPAGLGIFDEITDVPVRERAMALAPRLAGTGTPEPDDAMHSADEDLVSRRFG